jgi:DNA helicase IV
LAQRKLTINYRTPAEIMELAARVVPEVEPPVSVRRTGVAPWIRQVPAENLAEVVRKEVAAHDGGTLAVIAPEGVQLDDVSVLTPRAAKGLEFDVVIVVEPGRIESAADLYVALTRATQRLGILHTTALPEALRVE